MSTKTAIQWTDVTDNIIVVEGGGWWCRMISPGCVHCYAAKLNQSDFFGGNGLSYSGAVPKLKLRYDVIDGWARQRHPKKHFVASMTDVFGEWVTYGWVKDFLGGMIGAPKQTFQVLTKRPDVARRQIARFLDERVLERLPENIWIGTSVENQEWADKRIPELIQIRAAVHFLSVEPMLEAVNLGLAGILPKDLGLGFHPLSDYIDWVIVGGESGPGARPCATAWIRSLVNECRQNNVACFVKQLGANPACECGELEGLKHPKGGDPEEWPRDLRIRHFPFAFKEA